MSRGRILLTGATGILGSWVLAESLRRGYSPVAVMRDRSITDARARLKAVLGLAGIHGGEHDVEILTGDSTKENLGLSATDIAGMRRSLDGIIHCAACTSFSPEQDEEVLTTNIGGTKNVLSLAVQTDAPLFHVSTAYVCGRRSGRIAERDLEHDAGYNNTYERSKNEAEGLVRAAFTRGDVHGAVYRPGIIVGATDGGRICQFSNFYKLLQAIDYGAPRARRNGSNFRLFGDPACTINLVPVDWSANQLWDGIETEGASGKSYHMTNHAPPTMEFIVEWLNSLLGDSGVRIELSPDIEEQDAVIRRATKHFEGYVLDEPVFDRKNMNRATPTGGECPEIDTEFLASLFSYGKSQGWRNIFDVRRRDAQPVNGAAKHLGRPHAVAMHRQPQVTP